MGTLTSLLLEPHEWRLPRLRPLSSKAGIRIICAQGPLVTHLDARFAVLDRGPATLDYGKLREPWNLFLSNNIHLFLVTNI